MALADVSDTGSGVAHRPVRYARDRSVNPFPTLDPSASPDAFQSFQVQAATWNGDAMLLLIFVVVTVGALLIFNSAISAIAEATGR